MLALPLLDELHSPALRIVDFWVVLFASVVFVLKQLYIIDIIQLCDILKRQDIRQVAYPGTLCLRGSEVLPNSGRIVFIKRLNILFYDGKKANATSTPLICWKL